MLEIILSAVGALLTAAYLLLAGLFWIFGDTSQSLRIRPCEAFGWPVVLCIGIWRTKP